MPIAEARNPLIQRASKWCEGDGQSAQPTSACGSTRIGGSAKITGPELEARNLPVPIRVRKPGTIDCLSSSGDRLAGDPPFQRRTQPVAAAHPGVAERHVPGVGDHGAGGGAHRVAGQIDLQHPGPVEPERLHGRQATGRVRSDDR
jgi:hypothetical protein